AVDADGLLLHILRGRRRERHEADHGTEDRLSKHGVILDEVRPDLLEREELFTFFTILSRREKAAAEWAEDADRCQDKPCRRSRGAARRAAGSRERPA